MIKEVVKTVVKNERQQSKIVHHPIRSGQQVYAADGDLIIMASVSAGAEILADGNIHVYGALRGRK
ncbi:septum site-determining protein MinC [Shewanella sp.]|uniref:septum site-determining protein MinC n=1 Tax=Shewanella sp. TaxID=50422 RepID=UPI00404818C1